jgi:GT2 family glycosyltransferase
VGTLSEFREIRIVTETSPAPGPLRIIVGIATIGRPEVLNETLEELRRQTRQPDRIVVSHHTDRDVEDIQTQGRPIVCVKSPAGLTIQRNAILRMAQGFDVVAFFDDDFFPCPNYIEVIEQAFCLNPDYQVVTGCVLADGAKGLGIAPSVARDLVARDQGVPKPLKGKDTYNGYGCNMSVRLSNVFKHQILFDENLPLYGWLEDVDFCRRLVPFGRIVKIDGARGVHLGVKAGRTKGARLGYSQIANPMYMFRRGTLSWRLTMQTMVKHLAINSVRSIYPESHVDRMGRLRGNVTALSDLMWGRCHPKRMLEL